MNKWSLELEEEETLFINQATQENAWDKVLLTNGKKIVELNQSVEKVKSEQEATPNWKSASSRWKKSSQKSRKWMWSAVKPNGWDSGFPAQTNVWRLKEVVEHLNEAKKNIRSKWSNGSDRENIECSHELPTADEKLNIDHIHKIGRKNKATLCIAIR